MSKEKTIGYAVLESSNNSFVTDSNGEVLFNNKRKAESVKDGDNLDVVSVQHTESDMDERVLSGEVLEYQHDVDKIIAYVRAGRDVYAVRYVLDSYQKSDNYKE